MAGSKRRIHTSRTQPRDKDGRFSSSPSTKGPSPTGIRSPTSRPSSSRRPSPSSSRHTYSTTHPSRGTYYETPPAPDVPATGIKGGAGPSKYKGKGASASKVKKVNARHTLYLLAGNLTSYSVLSVFWSFGGFVEPSFLAQIENPV